MVAVDLTDELVELIEDRVSKDGIELPVDALERVRDVLDDVIEEACMEAC